MKKHYFYHEGHEGHEEMGAAQPPREQCRGKSGPQITQIYTDKGRRSRYMSYSSYAICRGWSCPPPGRQ